MAFDPLKKFFLAVDASARPARLGIYPVTIDAHKREKSLNFDSLLSDAHHFLFSAAQESTIELESLGKDCADLLNHAQLQWEQCAGILWGEGPGSFTGLRVSASFFQTIASCFQIPNFSVDSLMASAQAFLLYHRDCHLPLPDSFKVIVIRPMTARMNLLGFYECNPAQVSWIQCRAHQPVSYEQLSQGIANFTGSSEDVYTIFDGTDLKKLEHLQAALPSAHSFFSAQQCAPYYLKSFFFLKHLQILHALNSNGEWTLTFEPHYFLINDANIV